MNTPPNRIEVNRIEYNGRKQNRMECKGWFACDKVIGVIYFYKFILPLWIYRTYQVFSFLPFALSFFTSHHIFLLLLSHHIFNYGSNYLFIFFVFHTQSPIFSWFFLLFIYQISFFSCDRIYPFIARIWCTKKSRGTYVPPCIFF